MASNAIRRLQVRHVIGDEDLLLRVREVHDRCATLCMNAEAMIEENRLIMKLALQMRETARAYSSRNNA